MAVAFNEPKYEIEPSDFRCAACANEVPPETAFFSAVFFEGELFRRRNFCPGCWKSPPFPLSDAFAFWRSRRPAPHAPVRRLRFDVGLLLEFFRRLSEPAAPASQGEQAAAPPPAAEQPAGSAGESAALPPPEPPRAAPPTEGEKVRLRLVISLLLIRRKVLVFESSAMRDGREWLKLTEKANPEKVYLVENPPLTDEQLEAVKISLGELLQMDLG